jgi:site-specific DNA-methyltransferase (adenine-specific)
MIIHGDSLHELKNLADNSIDFICTDPPYGYSFMGKDWDKAVPSVEIWKECCRVLKPGAFACVMSAPRSDVQQAMVERLIQGGFRLDFTPIYWTYASGFPKAGNIGKLVDKRLGAEREIVGTNPNRRTGRVNVTGYARGNDVAESEFLTTASSPEAKALDGSYAGFQPKPAVEVIIVAMKPLSEKTYVDQALKNGKGISWLDDGRIPTGEVIPKTVSSPTAMGQNSGWNKHENRPVEYEQHTAGRFPANLLVSDDVLNDGVERRANGNKTSIENKPVQSGFLQDVTTNTTPYSDNGSYSRYFDLDKWASTLPFLIVPKASKSEKNKGLDSFEEKKSRKWRDDKGMTLTGSGNPRNEMSKNHHPTVKPLKLMSYLITLFTRPGDIVLDPFVGSGTTCVAAEMLERESIGIEREQEYVEIAMARLAHIKPQPKQLPPEQPIPGQPPVTIENLTQARLFDI